VNSATAPNVDTSSFVRLNFATSADNLREIVTRIGALYRA